MSSKKAVQVLSNLAKTGASNQITFLAKTSPYAHVTRNSPNADKLIDGAIQR